MNEIETINNQLVGTNGGDIVVLFAKPRMTPTEALRHAAWLVVLAEAVDEPDAPRFDDVLRAVKNT